MSFHLHLSFVYGSNKGSGEFAQLRRLARALLNRKRDGVQNLTAWLNLNGPFKCPKRRFKCGTF